MTKVIKNLLLLALVISAAVPSGAEDGLQGRSIRVEGRKSAVVSTASVRLSDIAEVSSTLISDDDAVIALKKIEISQSPAAGDETTLPAAKVLERLQQEGVDLKRVTYVLPRVISIKRASRQLSVSELQNAIIDYFSKSGRDVVVKSIDYQGDKHVSPATSHIEVTPYNTLKPLEMGFSVKAKADGESDVRFNTKAVIDEWLQVPVAKRPLSRGAHITIDDYVMARLNLAALPADAARDEEDVRGLEASSEISPGEIFRKNKLIVPPVIAQGSKVTLYFKRGALEARATGTALENGGAGEEIKIRNDASKKIVSGKVVDAGLVEVN